MNHLNYTNNFLVTASISGYLTPSKARVFHSNSTYTVREEINTLRVAEDKAIIDRIERMRKCDTHDLINFITMRVSSLGHVYDLSDDSVVEVFLNNVDRHCLYHSANDLLRIVVPLASQRLFDRRDHSEIDQISIKAILQIFDFILSNSSSKNLFEILVTIGNFMKFLPDYEQLLYNWTFNTFYKFMNENDSLALEMLFPFNTVFNTSTYDSLKELEYLSQMIDGIYHRLKDDHTELFTTALSSYLDEAENFEISIDPTKVMDLITTQDNKVVSMIIRGLINSPLYGSTNRRQLIAAPELEGNTTVRKMLTIFGS